MLHPRPHGGPNPHVGGVQVWHRWDALCGVGAVAQSQQGTPPWHRETGCCAIGAPCGVETGRAAWDRH